MYYSYRCTYCGRQYYTYAHSREQASVVLYRAIKQHLIDYDEDRREYEMDDGEELDSDQIYHGIAEYKERPAGAYEAPMLGEVGESEHTGNKTPTSTTSSSQGLVLVFLFLIVVILVCLYFLVPEFQDFVLQWLPQF